MANGTGTGVPATEHDAPRTIKPGWKTIVGGIIVGTAPVLEIFIPGFSEAAQAVMQAIGTVIGVIGVRHAISKNGYGV